MWALGKLLVDPENMRLTAALTDTRVTDMSQMETLASNLVEIFETLPTTLPGADGSAGSGGGGGGGNPNP